MSPLLDTLRAQRLSSSLLPAARLFRCPAKAGVDAGGGIFRLLRFPLQLRRCLDLESRATHEDPLILALALPEKVESVFLTATDYSPNEVRA